MRLIDADELIMEIGENDLFVKMVKDAPTVEIGELLPSSPIGCAEMLISACYEYETSTIQKAFGAGEKARSDYYSVDELRQIAEHLLVYCNHADDGED